MQLREIAESKRDLLIMHPSKLSEEPGFNARQDYGDLEALALSIAENGVRVPLEIRLSGENAYIVDGHRRWRASLIAIEKYAPDMKGIPCQVEERGTSPADRILAQITRNDGKPLEPFEEMDIFKRLVALHWTESDIAKKIGKTIAYVQGRLNLGAASDEVKAAVTSGQMSVGAAEVLAQAPAEKQKEIVKAANGKKIKTRHAKIQTGKKAGARPYGQIEKRMKSPDISKDYRAALKWVLYK